MRNQKSNPVQTAFQRRVHELVDELPADACWRDLVTRIIEEIELERAAEDAIAELISEPAHN